MHLQIARRTQNSTPSAMSSIGISLCGSIEDQLRFVWVKGAESTTAHAWAKQPNHSFKIPANESFRPIWKIRQTKINGILEKYWNVRQSSLGHRPWQDVPRTICYLWSYQHGRNTLVTSKSAREVWNVPLASTCQILPGCMVLGFKFNISTWEWKPHQMRHAFESLSAPKLWHLPLRSWSHGPIRPIPLVFAA